MAHKLNIVVDYDGPAIPEELREELLVKVADTVSKYITLAAGQEMCTAGYTAGMKHTTDGEKS